MEYLGKNIIQFFICVLLDRKEIYDLKGIKGYRKNRFGPIDLNGIIDDYKSFVLDLQKTNLWYATYLFDLEINAEGKEIIEKKPLPLPSVVPQDSLPSVIINKVYWKEYFKTYLKNFKNNALTGLENTYSYKKQQKLLWEELSDTEDIQDNIRIVNNKNPQINLLENLLILQKEKYIKINDIIIKENQEPSVKITILRYYRPPKIEGSYLGLSIHPDGIYYGDNKLDISFDTQPFYLFRRLILQKGPISEDVLFRNLKMSTNPSISTKKYIQILELESKKAALKALISKQRKLITPYGLDISNKKHMIELCYLTEDRKREIEEQQKKRKQEKF